jgi:bifunctional non-homologous end joining protein LigD
LGDLAEYRRKRDFGSTPEPTSPDEERPAGRGGRSEEGPAPQRFTVQRHDARRLHHDLRLERDGALASWAVPKGMPLREGPKRLAVRTEDHPLEYLTFEGVIPAGQYGAGRMSVWDTGTYEVEAWSGKEIKLVLEGERLRGHYHLVRTGGESGKEEWLLFRSGKGPAGSPDPVERFRALRPMLATSVDEPFDDPGWAFELKWDGYRALALVTPDLTELRSRTGRDLTPGFPALGDLRRAIMVEEAVLDGEVVVLDRAGRSDFQALQAGRGTPSYVAFDLLYADGEWLLERPWSERRALLEAALAPEGPPLVVRSDHVEGAGRALFEAARARGVEGVVAKRMTSHYAPARRGGEWRKVKGRQEIVAAVGGYTVGAGMRRDTLGALIVGSAEDEGLRYLAHVGSGLTDADLSALRRRLDDLGAPDSPFLEPPPPGRGTPRWVRPEITCRVLFAEWTDEGRLRAPVFAGLAPDVPAAAARADPPRRHAPAALTIDLERAEQRIVDGGREVRLTNLRKPFWPEEGIVKGDLLRHYADVAPFLVPHLSGRPMILKRYPNGWDQPFFFQHNLPADAPQWLRAVDVPRSEKPGSEPNRYGVVEDALSLLWMVNLGCIDLNPWQSRAETPGEPTHVLFDLDPSEGVPFDAVVEAALMVREALDALGLRGYPKTSGASGMHIFLPVPPGLTYGVTRLFAQAVSEALRRARPDLVTTETFVADRGPRVYLDANQNGRGRSVASAYSVRPRPGAPVSTPLRWEEVRPGLDPRDLDMATVRERTAADGDLFAPVLHDLQDLAPAVARLGDGGPLARAAPRRPARGSAGR